MSLLKNSVFELNCVCLCRTQYRFEHKKQCWQIFTNFPFWCPLSGGIVLKMSKWSNLQLYFEFNIRCADIASSEHWTKTNQTYRRFEEKSRRCIYNNQSEMEWYMTNSTVMKLTTDMHKVMYTKTKKKL